MYDSATYNIENVCDMQTKRKWLHSSDDLENDSGSYEKSVSW